MGDRVKEAGDREGEGGKDGLNASNHVAGADTSTVNGIVSGHEFLGAWDGEGSEVLKDCHGRSERAESTSSGSRHCCCLTAGLLLDKVARFTRVAGSEGGEVLASHFGKNGKALLLDPLPFWPNGDAATACEHVDESTGGEVLGSHFGKKGKALLLDAFAFWPTGDAPTTCEDADESTPAPANEPEAEAEPKQRKKEGCDSRGASSTPEVQGRDA